MLSHEGVSEGQRGYTGLGPSHARRQGRMIRASGVRMIRMESRMIRLRWKPSGVFGAVTRTIRRGTRMIRLGPDDPDGGPDVRASFSRSFVFFSFLPSSLPCLALILGFFMIISIVPEYMQGPCMR